MRSPLRLEEIARKVGARVEGDADRVIAGIATLEAAGPAELAFFTNSKYRAQAERTEAGAVLVGPATRLGGRTLLVADEPYRALARLLELFHPPRPPRRGISPDARIGAQARLGADVYVGPFAVIGDEVGLGDRCVIEAGAVIDDGCEIGADTVLGPRVVLYAGTRVGARCRIHAGAVLGADGFGFATSGGTHHKIPQVGRVVVEDDVEIGALAAVDRAAIGETRIGSGTKIDDLVMVAHGVRVGPNCLLAGQAGVAGSAILGSGVTLAGQAGVAGHVTLGDGTVVAAKSAVFSDLPGGGFVAGIPATGHMEWKRSVAAVRRLAGMQRELRALERRLGVLESGSKDREGDQG